MSSAWAAFNSSWRELLASLNEVTEVRLNSVTSLEMFSLDFPKPPPPHSQSHWWLGHQGPQRPDMHHGGQPPQYPQHRHQMQKQMQMQ